MNKTEIIELLDRLEVTLEIREASTGPIHDHADVMISEVRNTIVEAITRLRQDADSLY